MVKSRFALLVLPCAAALPARSEDDCSDLIKHGIYNYSRQTTKAASASATTSDICTQYQRLQSDKKSGKGSAKYGVGSLSLELSEEQLEQIGSSMCASSSSSASADKFAESASSIISADALSAYKQCKALRAIGLRVESSFNDDEQGTKLITTSISYATNGKWQGTPKLKGIIVSPAASHTCTGPLAQAPIDAPIDSVLTMTCARAIVNTPQQVGSKYYYALPSQVTVSTEAGPVNYSLPGIEAVAPATTPPVGSVLLFAGATPPKGWLSCDGASVSKSAYPVLFAALGGRFGAAESAEQFRVPDLRGRFPIGAGQASAPLSARLSGATGGSERHQLTVAELPSHSHTGQTSRAESKFYRVVSPRNSDPGDATSSAANHQTGWPGGPRNRDANDSNFSNADHIHSFTTNVTGGNASFEKLPPFLALSCILRAE